MKTQSGTNLQQNQKSEVSPKIIENLRKSGSNKNCADCGDKSTSFIVLNFGTFVCHRCALHHKELNHTIKDLNTSRFYESDQNILTKYGNEKAKILWMEKFDSKKEKIPKSKDGKNFKKFLSDKYLNKKYASTYLDKELSSLPIEKNNPKENFSEHNSSSDDSSTPGKNLTPGENMITPENKPNPEQTEEKEKKKLEKFEMNENPLNSNEKNEVVYPVMTSCLLESASSPGVECQVFKENGQNDRNLFFFENFNTPCDNNVDITDWGFVWENVNKSKPLEKETNTVEELDRPEEDNSNSKENIFNLIKEEKTDTFKARNNEVKKSDWEFPVEFDLVTNKTNTTTSSNTSPDCITSLSQNLNGIYSNYSNTNSNNKKTFDDLERYLSDSTFTTPAGKKPVAIPLPVNNITVTATSTSNYVPTNSIFPSVTPQMMMNYSYNINQINNNYEMHKQSQTDYFTTNVRETYYNYNNNNTFNNNYGGINHRSSFGSTSENLDNNFNFLNLNPQQQQNDQNSNTRTYSSSQSNSMKYDAFKDIYNYSKNNKNTPHKPFDNMNNPSSINSSDPSKKINNMNNPYGF